MIDTKSRKRLIQETLDQLLGGEYRMAQKVVKTYPMLRGRWSYEELCSMAECLVEIDCLVAEGTVSGVADPLKRYFDLRGEERELAYCRDLGTGEYCVVWFLMKEEEYKRARRKRHDNE